MAESELLLSPTDNGDVVALSQKVYRKRILPKATINYRGRKIQFDDSYLADLANSFQQGAYDQVAFMLADTNNAHTLDPERFRGEVQSVEVDTDGLYATIQVTPEAARVLEQNPKLGVSARILENYQRSDGKQFPRALQHVLGTLDPVIPGLGTWEEVALSNGVPAENVIDLSATSYEELEHMATRADHLQQVATAAEMTVAELEALDMTDEELAIFASAFDIDTSAEAATTAEADDELIEEPGEPGYESLFDASETSEPTDADIEAAVENLSDEELEALAAELGLLDEETADEATSETAEETEPVAEKTGEEPTDADLVARLESGDFNSGLGTEDPTLGSEEGLDEISDEDLAAMWEKARLMDEAAEAGTPVEDAAVAEEAAEAAAAAAAEAEPARELVGAGAVTLSNEASPDVISLSNQVTRLQHELALQQFDTLKADYVRKGVPAALVDLARPVLVAGSAATLEFSNAVGGIEIVDAAAIVRQLLDSATGYIDLARERGHSYSPEREDRAAMEAQEDKHLASLWGEQFGN